MEPGVKLYENHTTVATGDRWIMDLRAVYGRRRRYCRPNVNEE